MSVPGHFPEQTEFLLPVKTPLRRILPERMSFELSVEVMMMMEANHYHNDDDNDDDDDAGQPLS